MRRRQAAASPNVRSRQLAGIAVFAVGIGCCLVLRPPDSESVQHGLSFYGARAATVVPFTIALVAVAVGTWTSASGLPARPRWRRPVIRAVAVLVGPVLLTPYTISTFVNQVHDALAGLIFFGSLVVALDAARRRGASAAVRILAGVQLAGDLLALYAFLDPTADMLVGQLISLAGFLPLLAVLSGTGRDTSAEVGHQG